VNVISMGVEQLEETGDKVKDVVLATLVGDGLLDGEKAGNWSMTHAIVFKQPGRVSRWYRALLGKDEPGAYNIACAEIPRLGNEQA